MELLDTFIRSSWKNWGVLTAKQKLSIFYRKLYDMKEYLSVSPCSVPFYYTSRGFVSGRTPGAMSDK